MTRHTSSPPGSDGDGASAASAGLDGIFAELNVGARGRGAAGAAGAATRQQQ
jgi:hypothetical protein